MKLNVLLTAVLCSTAIIGCSTHQSSSSNLVSGIYTDHIDSSVRPQDDFYLYVNGRWLKNNQIPADKSRIGTFYNLRDKARKDSLGIVQQLAQQNDLSQGSEEQKISNLYNSFMDEAVIEQQGAQPIRSEMHHISQLQTKSDLAKYFARGIKLGLKNPLAAYVSEDAKQTDQYALHVWQWGLGLPDRDYYLNEEERFATIRSQYEEHLFNMFKLAGFNNPEQAAKSVFSLETNLAKEQWTRVETRDSDKTYNKMTISELYTLAGDFNWSYYLNALGVENPWHIIINQPSYIKGFAQLIQQHTMADWKLYLQWKLLNSSAPLLNKAFADENFDFFNRKLNGQDQPKDRWKRGIDLVNSTLGEAVGKVYVKQHFTPQAKKRMGELVENLRTAYSRSIDELEWMSAETKKQAKDKLNKFIPKIGYPEEWIDYSSLIVNQNDLIGNMKRANQFEFNRQLNKLGRPIQKHEWFMTPQTVNAYYSPTKNEIVFPAAILQPPFFNLEADDAINYGAIGAVIGHEMGHGFDDQGSKYDGNGTLKNWWTDQDRNEFKKRTTGLVKQYNEYQALDDLTVNGELTLGENIGDLSGVTIAYKAYQLSLENKPAPIIDNYTGDQRFFIGYAQVWAVKYKEEDLRNQVATNTHSPGHFRANGPLSNVPEFYQAFDVNSGDSMYIAPQERIKIW